MWGKAGATEVVEELSLSIFLLQKVEQAVRSLAEQQFLAEIKVA